jgi:hypothetical protein
MNTLHNSCKGGSRTAPTFSLPQSSNNGIIIVNYFLNETSLSRSGATPQRIYNNFFFATLRLCERKRISDEIQEPDCNNYFLHNGTGVRAE